MIYESIGALVKVKSAHTSLTDGLFAKGQGFARGCLFVRGQYFHLD